MEPSGYVTRPDYRVDLLARRNRFTARAGDTVLASSERCLLVDEQDHGIVVYFPREDVELGALTATDSSSRCPYKGNASYWRLARGEGDGGADVAWSYEEPYAEVARIAGYVAFYQDRVTVSVGVATPAVSGR
jgi:uncharacterized protein (DUF427 family)